MSARVGGSFPALRRVARPVAAAGAVMMMAACAAPDFDVVFRGGTVVDGSGATAFSADVGVVAGRIAAVGDLAGADAVEDVDASGLFIAPGFVNLHSHGRLSGLPTAENLLLQGVTTVVLNADGGGPVDLAGQLEAAQEAGLAVNVAANIGFNAIWSEVNGPDDERPTAADLEQMNERVEQGLRDGAWGVSAGLDYKPAYYARTEEVIAALDGLEPWRTVFTNHDRVTPESGYSSRVGMRETIEIGEAIGLMPLITHMKVQGNEQGSIESVLDMMNAAGVRGAYTAADAYPYLAGQTSLAALIVPGWAQEGGRDAMRARFADPAQRARIVVEADEALAARFDGPGGVYLPGARRELTDVMAELGVGSGGEAVVALLEDESPTAILRFGAESDLEGILRHPTTSVACDCDAAEGEVSHPRGFGTFPRVLGRYVRERRVLEWEEAVRKMSGLPAVTVGMIDRGFVAPGMAADLVVFDTATVIDHATFEEPSLPSEGIVHVLVNGSWAVRDGAATGAQGGEVLRRTPTMPARPMSDGERSFRVEPVSGAVGDVRVEASLSQGPGQAGASGSLVVEVGDVRLTAVELGPLQTTADWAAVSAWAETPSGDGHAVVVVIDGADPRRAGEPGFSLTVWIDGEVRAESIASAGVTIEG